MADPALGNGLIGSRVPGHYGQAGAAVALGETTIAAAWNVQGDATRESFRAAAQRLFAIDLPQVPNTAARNATWTTCWLGPKSWLLIATTAAPHPDAFAAQRDALNAVGGALFDLSASRVAFTIAGAQAGTVLAKRCPLDFHTDSFPAGTCAQSLLGHTNALILRAESAPAFTVLVARSLERDAWRTLCVSAAPYGYEVVRTTA